MTPQQDWDDVFKRADGNLHDSIHIVFELPDFLSFSDEILAAAKRCGFTRTDDVESTDVHFVRFH